MSPAEWWGIPTTKPQLEERYGERLSGDPATRGARWRQNGFEKRKRGWKEEKRRRGHAEEYENRKNAKMRSNRQG